MNMIALYLKKQLKHSSKKKIKKRSPSSSPMSPTNDLFTSRNELDDPIYDEKIFEDADLRYRIIPGLLSPADHGHDS